MKDEKGKTRTRMPRRIDRLDAVQTGIDIGTARAGMRRMAPIYRETMSRPIVEAIESVGEETPGDNRQQLTRLLGALGGDVVQKMNSSELEESLALTMVTAAGIGAASAAPKELTNDD